LGGGGWFSDLLRSLVERFVGFFVTKREGGLKIWKIALRVMWAFPNRKGKIFRENGEILKEKW
jgi:hypothetical protein